MTFFAIKDTSTGYYLPQCKYKKGRTWVELGEHEMPRLFKRKSDARQALNQWLCGGSKYGIIPATHASSEEWEIITTYNPTRIASNMVIIRVQIVEVQKEN